MTSIEDIYRKYPDQWVAVKVTGKEEHRTVAGEVLAVAPTSRKLYRKIRLSREHLISGFFTRDPAEKGQAVLL